MNTNLNSRSWYLWRWDDEENEDDDGVADGQSSEAKAKKALSYTPSFGSHYFWYKGRLLLFKRSSNREQSTYMVVSEREEISVSCFGRNPWILKELLYEARSMYTEKDQKKTLIYRGTTKAGSVEPTWQRCMARASRPFSTVILNEGTKKKLVDDVSDYLQPATQRWYSNRGIPYRRGYLLHGPPGTGKSSLSLALAGFFKMRIYIVSLSSISANEENLGSLFAELPRRCVVLLEDIDTAGLTHTREDNKKDTSSGSGSSDLEPGQITAGNGNTNDNNNNNNNNNPNPGRLSLSGLLNILDGVASQEGRVLIMTTNHLEKLDKALIRPGRVDMIVEFGLADTGMTTAIFKAIFAHLEGDDGPDPTDSLLLDPEAKAALAKEKELKRIADEEQVSAFAEEFAARIPAHEFSPAELQGHLMRHKRDPQAAIDSAAEFVEQTRKDRKEKEIKEAEEKRKAEEQKKEDEAKKKKEEEEAKKKEEAEKAEAAEKEKKEKAKSEKHKKKKRSKKSKSAREETDSSSDDSSDSESEAEAKKDPVKAKLEVKVQAGHERKDSGYGTPASVEA